MHHSSGSTTGNVEINVVLVNALTELKEENDVLKERLERLEHLVGASAEN
jgi:hypothetical protein